MRRRFMNIKGFTETFDINNYLTIEAIEDGLTVSFENDIEYGIDGKGWIKLKKRANSPKLKVGQTISFKGKLNPVPGLGIGTFVVSHKCNLLGNVMSLLFAGDAMKQKSLIGYDYAFHELFLNCTNIVNVSINFLPATILANNCYYRMFNNCTSLTTAPELPATTLTDSCYYGMFIGCTSLTTAPTTLPATTLAYNCYRHMFNGCTGLTTAPDLPATTLANYCYYNMFYGCRSLNYIKMLATDISTSSCLSNWVNGVASTGTFVKNPDATWDVVGVSGVPEGWTVKFDGEEDGGGNLISFTIGGTQYQAEEGMTWEEWVNSEYNIDMTFGIDEFEGTSITNGASYVGTLTDYVKPSDLIIANYEYLLTW